MLVFRKILRTYLIDNPLKYETSTVKEIEKQFYAAPVNSHDLTHTFHWQTL